MNRFGSSWTLLIKNKMLGSARFCGTFATEAEAKEFADREAARSRSFAEFEVYTGNPQRPGEPTGYTTKGVH